MFEIGMVVVIVGSGIVGVITAIRLHRNTSDAGYADEGTELPPYVEIDHEVQVHPSRVRKHQEE